jgi:peptidoglycan/xylan/chitin deacetylase (PgdA/CDA1 family)
VKMMTTEAAARRACNDERGCMRNALTIDVEDYFQVTAFDGVVKRQDWMVYPSRVENNTRRVLDLLDEFSLSGTFFVLGWVAEHYPGVVKAIASGGHEVACHGYGHELVYNLEPQAFRSDVRRCKALLEDLTGAPVLGYRAPSYSITATPCGPWMSSSRKALPTIRASFPLSRQLRHPGLRAIPVRHRSRPAAPSANFP